MKNPLPKLWNENKPFILFVFLMLVFRSAVADWNDVPTGSMKPTIIEGDRIYVNKMAYDIRVPFTHLSLVELSAPKRGDIIVFDSEVSKKKLVKRVIGEPNDRVEMRDNVLWINGQELVYSPAGEQEAGTDQIEHLLGTTHRVRFSSETSRLSSFPEIRVPVGHYLVLGDNRNHSADSRIIGFVPRSEIVGKSSKVVVSFDYDNYYLPRTDRFFHTL